MQLAYSINGQTLREWYNEQNYRELFDVIRDEYDGVELYLGKDRNTTEKEGFFEIAEDAGIEVLSVHGPNLERLHLDNGSKEIAGIVNEYHTEYDAKGEREKIRDLEQVTMHPSQKKGEKEPLDWENAVYNIALASQTLKNWSNQDSISIENCARYDPPYLITEASDVESLVNEADSNAALERVGVPVNMTLDPGHAPQHSYREMVDAVSSSENVRFSSLHLHDKIEAQDVERKNEIRSEFDIPEEWEIGTEDWEGEMDHIPPGTGDIDLAKLSEIVDDGTLVTVELHPTYAERPEAVSYSARTAKNNLI